jgi:hypothetical protein
VIDPASALDITQFMDPQGQVCGEISDRIHHQYTLAYYPPEARDGRWHTVRIEIRIPGYRVVASKIGYFPATTISR